MTSDKVLPKPIMLVVDNQGNFEIQKKPKNWLGRAFTRINHFLFRKKSYEHLDADQVKSLNSLCQAQWKTSSEKAIHNLNTLHLAIQNLADSKDKEPGSRKVSMVVHNILHGDVIPSIKENPSKEFLNYCINTIHDVCDTPKSVEKSVVAENLERLTSIVEFMSSDKGIAKLKEAYNESRGDSQKKELLRDAFVAYTVAKILLRNPEDFPIGSWKAAAVLASEANRSLESLLDDQTSTGPIATSFSEYVVRQGLSLNSLEEAYQQVGSTVSIKKNAAETYTLLLGESLINSEKKPDKTKIVQQLNLDLARDLRAEVYYINGTRYTFDTAQKVMEEKSIPKNQYADFLLNEMEIENDDSGFVEKILAFSQQGALEIGWSLAGGLVHNFSFAGPDAEYKAVNVPEVNVREISVSSDKKTVTIDVTRFYRVTGALNEPKDIVLPVTHHMVLNKSEEGTSDEYAASVSIIDAKPFVLGDNANEKGKFTPEQKFESMKKAYEETMSNLGENSSLSAEKKNEYTKELRILNYMAISLYGDNIRDGLQNENEKNQFDNLKSRIAESLGV